MEDTEIRLDTTPVLLMDRALLGGCEFIHDGVRYVFAPEQVEKMIPRHVAEWLFRGDRARVHTTEGHYVHRFALKDAPADLLELLGEEVGDTEPIQIDTARAEGWDAEGMYPRRRVITLNNAEVQAAKREMREHLGSGSAGAFGSRR